MFELVCEKCGNIDVALVEGYAVGDRLLEDVWFEIRIKKGKVVINVTKIAEKYFSDLNTRKWLKAIKEFVEEQLKIDNGDEYIICSKCKGPIGKGDVEIDKKIDVKIISSVNLSDILKLSP